MIGENDNSSPLMETFKNVKSAAGAPADDEKTMIENVSLRMIVNVLKQITINDSKTSKLINAGLMDCKTIGKFFALFVIFFVFSCSKYIKRENKQTKNKLKAGLHFRFALLHADLSCVEEISHALQICCFCFLALF